MKFLITGGAGYIGSILIHHLLNEGYKVKCLDRLFFGRESLKDVESNPNIEIIKDDVRWFDPSILRNVSVVVDLAAISQPDPAKQLDPVKFYDIDYLGPVRVSNLSKEYGVERYILASTCSVYGFQEEVLDENSPPNPIEAYGRTKVLAEREVLPLSDKKFTVTVLRFATAYGFSPKIRFDLVVNGMTLSLFKTGKIRVMRKGTQWRPVVHVKDIAKAIIKVVKSDKKKVNKETFNVGSNDQNYQIYPLAKLIGNSIGVPYETEWYGEPDIRSYRVNFDKIRNVLGFKTEYTPREGAREIYEALQNGVITDSPKTSVIKWYKYLLESYRLMNEVVMRNTII